MGQADNAIERDVPRGFRAVGINALAFKIANHAVQSRCSREICILRANSIAFRNKLFLHNLICAIRFRWVTHAELVGILKDRGRVSIRHVKWAMSSIHRVQNGYLLAVGERPNCYPQAEFVDHELLHLGQYLRNERINDKNFLALRHEIIPLFLGNLCISIPLLIAIGAIWWWRAYH